MKLLNLTNILITQAASGGHNIRPRSTDKLEMHVSASSVIGDIVDAGIYEITLIKCDIFDDTIQFIGPDGIVAQFDGREGTEVLMEYIMVVENANIENTGPIKIHTKHPVIDLEEIPHHGG